MVSSWYDLVLLLWGTQLRIDVLVTVFRRQIHRDERFFAGFLPSFFIEVRIEVEPAFLNSLCGNGFA